MQVIAACVHHTITWNTSRFCSDSISQSGKSRPSYFCSHSQWRCNQDRRLVHCAVVNLVVPRESTYEKDEAGNSETVRYSHEQGVRGSESEGKKRGTGESGSGNNVMNRVSFIRCLPSKWRERIGWLLSLSMGRGNSWDEGKTGPDDQKRIHRPHDVTLSFSFALSVDI